MTFFLARHGATYNQPKNVAFFWQLLVVFLLNLLRMEKNFICNARKTEISPPWGPPGVALTPSPWRGGSCLSLSLFLVEGALISLTVTGVSRRSLI